MALKGLRGRNSMFEKISQVVLMTFKKERMKNMEVGVLHRKLVQEPSDKELTQKWKERKDPISEKQVFEERGQRQREVV